MTLLALDIPDNSAEVALWLESHLLGPSLGTLVAQLTALQQSTEVNVPSLGEVLGNCLEPVLDAGLQELPAPVLQMLLAYPRLLLDLQEIALIQGGPYWQNPWPTATASTQLVERGWQRLAAALPGRPADIAAADPAPIRERSTGRRWLPWVVSGTAAAAILLGVLAFQSFSARVPPSTGSVAWGWARDGALPEKTSPKVYLNQLADDAAEWFNKRPEDAQGLARRLVEFRQGCSVLLLADHQPLAPADREWLRERCRVWAGKIDQCLVAAESGKVQEARTDADAIVNQLVAALRKRAQAISG